jgi:opacity protein-like surface antigen
MQLRTLALLAALGAGMGVTTVASAQAPTWHGFYVDGAIGGRATNTETNLSITGVPGSQSNDFGKTNFLFEATAGWRWAPQNSPVVVGVGAFIDFAGTNAGETSSTNFGSLKIKQENRYGLSVDAGPNWRTMPYGKVTYAWSRFEGELAVTGCNSATNSQTASGWGLGGGVRHLQTNNLYFFAEVLYQDYGSERFDQTVTCGATPVPANTNFSASNWIAVIGGGWKF